MTGSGLGHKCGSFGLDWEGKCEDGADQSELWRGRILSLPESEGEGGLGGGTNGIAQPERDLRLFEPGPMLASTVDWSVFGSADERGSKGGLPALLCQRAVERRRH